MWIWLVFIFCYSLRVLSPKLIRFWPFLYSWQNFEKKCTFLPAVRHQQGIILSTSVYISIIFTIFQKLFSPLTIYWFLFKQKFDFRNERKHIYEKRGNRGVSHSADRSSLNSSESLIQITNMEENDSIECNNYVYKNNSISSILVDAENSKCTEIAKSEIETDKEWYK